MKRNPPVLAENDLAGGKATAPERSQPASRPPIRHESRHHPGDESSRPSSRPHLAEAADSRCRRPPGQKNPCRRGYPRPRDKRARPVPNRKGVLSRGQGNRHQGMVCGHDPVGCRWLLPQRLDAPAGAVILRNEQDRRPVRFGPDHPGRAVIPDGTAPCRLGRARGNPGDSSRMTVFRDRRRDRSRT